MVRAQIATVAGASVPYPFGGATRQIQVDLRPDALRAHGLSAADVNTALGNQNLILPAGTQKIGNYEYNVKLNASPLKLEELNDLPVKFQNGAVTTIRDVAFVHDGHPPQTNIVRVDGRRAVLMSIQKTGSASTLDIVNTIKEKLPLIRELLPEGASIAPTGDQSVFVEAAVKGVATEGIIAAALTALMILLFLGSWRSTLIITISIPLSVLSSIILLNALGETINLMTLGGLALAVGILVDDATVTIENINRHLEEGSSVENAILEGSHQILVPALVSTLSICIVFVPMFLLAGVSRYLFVPMAEAVVFAMLTSYVLSRTLIPTLAKYWLRTHAEEQEAQKNPNAWQRFQKRFEARFENIRQHYHHGLEGALKRGKPFIAGFLAIVLASMLLYPMLGRNFFPEVDAGQIKLHVRAHRCSRGAVRGSRRSHRRRRAENHSAQRAGQHRRQRRPAGVQHQHDVRQFGIDRQQRRRRADHVDEGSRPDRRLREDAARNAAAPVPGHRVRVPAGRHRQPDPELRPAGADRRADRRREPEEPGHRQRDAGKTAPRAGPRGPAHPADLQSARAARHHRPQPRATARIQPARRRKQPAADSLRQRADFADVLAES